MRRRHPLLVAALVATAVLVAAPLVALAECTQSHVSVASTEEPAKVTAPAPAPDPAGLQARASEPSADRDGTTEAKPEVR